MVSGFLPMRPGTVCDKHEVGTSLVALRPRIARKGVKHVRQEPLRVLMTLVRVWLGYQWFTSGLGKVQNPAWMEGGAAVRGFWMRAAGLLPETESAIRYSWYQSFIEMLIRGDHHIWFAPMVAVGEVLVGAALILGSLTVFSVVMGAFMNLNFMLAGTASSNPILYTLSMLIIAAGTGVSGYYGVDRALIPFLRNAVLSRLQAMGREPSVWVQSWMSGTEGQVTPQARS